MADNTIIIEYPVSGLEPEGRHIQDKGEGWHLTGRNGKFSKVVMTEDEIYKALIKARRERRIAESRVNNLELLLQELCKQKRGE